MPHWDFVVDRTGWAVEAITPDSARRAAQALLDREYGKGSYVVSLVQRPREPRPNLVVSKVVPPAGARFKVWDYAIPMHSQGARCHQFVRNTVEAQLAATACVKAQAAIDGAYGRGVFRVIVALDRDGNEQLQVRRN